MRLHLASIHLHRARLFPRQRGTQTRPRPHRAVRLCVFNQNSDAGSREELVTERGVAKAQRQQDPTTVKRVGIFKAS